VIAALVIDPILHANHHKGIMDYAGEAGRAAVAQFIQQFPRDMDALAWLVKFASEQAQPHSPAVSNAHSTGPHPQSHHSTGSSTKSPRQSQQTPPDLSELDKAIAEDQKAFCQQGLNDFNKRK
jgi:hypothetical protein